MLTMQAHISILAIKGDKRQAPISMLAAMNHFHKNVENFQTVQSEEFTKLCWVIRRYAQSNNRETCRRNKKRGCQLEDNHRETARE